MFLAALARVQDGGRQLCWTPAISPCVGNGVIQARLCHLFLRITVLDWLFLRLFFRWMAVLRCFNKQN